MSYTTSELFWVDQLLLDLGVHTSLPIPLLCDNKAAQHISHNPVFLERTMHLNVDCHFVLDKQQEGFLFTSHVRSGIQLADIMTKPLATPQHKFLSVKLGLQHGSCSPT
ncbi:hypothetical protein vseg_001735 [Gypsophila vaccaria]